MDTDPNLDGLAEHVEHGAEELRAALHRRFDDLEIADIYQATISLQQTSDRAAQLAGHLDHKLGVRAAAGGLRHDANRDVDETVGVAGAALQLAQSRLGQVARDLQSAVNELSHIGVVLTPDATSANGPNGATPAP